MGMIEGAIEREGLSSSEAGTSDASGDDQDNQGGDAGNRDAEGEPHPDETYGQAEGLMNIEEDSCHSRLGTAKVEWVLPSDLSTQRDGQCCWEPSPD